uniref:Protein phosphatase 2C n=1 Tax=Candidatus Kentrum eta TaxID=2126337 RepID=A0A450U9Y8_9GAMM|nr:MAG: Protein phosphatase 2C [Candidatus Kentron sp. H]VFJ89799.1 MAG: Protein phosphatase 2C [Candidatus Kentron sp. H]VFJ97146.1 MAG: Protein phosphatase 2C [Candidatus Kentron sp. H]
MWFNRVSEKYRFFRIPSIHGIFQSLRHARFSTSKSGSCGNGRVSETPSGFSSGSEPEDFGTGHSQLQKSSDVNSSVSIKCRTWKCGAWKIVGTSVPGFSREVSGKNTQDTFEIYPGADSTFVAVLSDGAGSSSHGGICASYTTTTVGRDLSRWASEHHAKEFDISKASEAIRGIVGGVRAVIIRHAKSEKVNKAPRDFHATLLGVCVLASGGFFFHIGDGAGVACRSGNYRDRTLSPPENGEFIETTYFLTEENWEEHLRITQFPKDHDLIVLMSDGCTPFAMDQRDEYLHEPFIHPVSAFLTDCDDNCQQALSNLLREDRIRAITGDDKTFIWARMIDGHTS